LYCKYKSTKLEFAGSNCCVAFLNLFINQIPIHSICTFTHSILNIGFARCLELRLHLGLVLNLLSVRVSLELRLHLELGLGLHLLRVKVCLGLRLHLGLGLHLLRVRFSLGIGLHLGLGLHLG
jgi:hypothetical protein